MIKTVYNKNSFNINKLRKVINTPSLEELTVRTGLAGMNLINKEIARLITEAGLNLENVEKLNDIKKIKPADQIYTPFLGNIKFVIDPYLDIAYEDYIDGFNRESYTMIVEESKDDTKFIKSKILGILKLEI